MLWSLCQPAKWFNQSGRSCKSHLTSSFHPLTVSCDTFGHQTICYVLHPYCGNSSISIQYHWSLLDSFNLKLMLKVQSLIGFSTAMMMRSYFSMSFRAANI